MNLVLASLPPADISHFTSRSSCIEEPNCVLGDVKEMQRFGRQKMLRDSKLILALVVYSSLGRGSRYNYGDSMFRITSQ